MIIDYVRKDPFGDVKMISRSTEIYNGKVRLHTVNTDRFKMSRFSVNFVTKQDKYRTPLTRLMLSVMMRGSERYPTVTAINKALDEQYGAAVTFRNVTVGEKSINKISCKILKDSYALEGDDAKILENVVAILANVLFHPLKDENGLFLSSYTESEKRIAIDAIRSKINDPKAYASEQCSKYMFEGSEYSVAGDGNEELIDSFTAKEITENFDNFMRDCRVECYYVGNESHEHVESLIKKYFPLENVGMSDMSYAENPYITDRRDVKNIEETSDVSQGRLVLGYRCGTVLADKDYYAMSLFNEMFGGSSVSKLFLNVREKKSLCYYCYSSLHSATGTIKVGCGIDPEKKDDALSEIALQLDAVKRGDFTDAEMEIARKTLISGFRQMNDSPASIEAFAFRRLLAGISESVDGCREAVMNVTAEDVIRAANKVVLDTVYFLDGNGEEEEYYE